MTKVTMDYVEVTDIFPAAKPTKKIDNMLYSGKVVDSPVNSDLTKHGITISEPFIGTTILIAKLFTFQGPDGPKYFAHRNAIVATLGDD